MAKFTTVDFFEDVLLLSIVLFLITNHAKVKPIPIHPEPDNMFSLNNMAIETLVNNIDAVEKEEYISNNIMTNVTVINTRIMNSQIEEAIINDEKKEVSEVPVETELVMEEKPAALEFPPYFSTVYDPKYTAEMLDAVNNLPQFVKDVIICNDYKIIIVGKNGYLENMFGYKSILGLTDYDFNTIYVEAYKDIVVSTDTLYHELGHMLDEKLDFISFSEEFCNIYNAELGSVMRTSFYKNVNKGTYANVNCSDEYFATTFSMYMLYPSELKAYCPQTYNYFNTLFNYYVYSNDGNSLNMNHGIRC